MFSFRTERSAVGNVSDNYSEAANRHFTDSDHLAGASRWGNAGHLLGFAAECAVKHCIKTLRPTAGGAHGHFPELIGIARKHLRTRRDAAMNTVLKTPDLLDGWHVNLRYEADAAVGEVQYSNWRKHTVRLLGAARLNR
jgi:hypothetical protein